MPAVAFRAPSVSSSPVKMVTITFDAIVSDSVTLNSTGEPSTADAGPIDTVAKFTMVPTADAVPMVTPAGSVVPVMVTLRVSSCSAVVSVVVCTVSVAVVSPASIVTLPLVTAV